MENYSLKWDAFDTITGQKIGKLIKVDGRIPTITIGGQVSADSLYLDAYWQKTGEADGTGQIHRNSATLHNNSEADRSNYAITLGYKLDNGVNIFGGYKNSESKIDGTARFQNFPATYNLDTKIDAHGPFLGAGYELNLGPGILSFTGSWARLYGKTTGTFYDNTGAVVFDMRTKPDADNFALGLAWKAPITDKVSYGVSIDGYQCNYDKKSLRDGTGAQTIPMRVKEQSIGINASIAYSF